MRATSTNLTTHALCLPHLSFPCRYIRVQCPSGPVHFLQLYLYLNPFLNIWLGRNNWDDFGTSEILGRCLQKCVTERRGHGDFRILD